jgi:signal peptidase II
LNRFVLIGVILSVLAVDQATKELARTHLAGREVRRYAGNVVTLMYTENTGAFLSLGAELPRVVRRVVFDTAVAVGLLIGLFLLFAKKIRAPGDQLVFAFILGGGIGNIIDRIVFDGRVTDFIYLSAGPLHTGIFNVADMAITLAVIWLLLAHFFIKPKVSEEAPSG